jgi:hypothetical protein
MGVFIDILQAWGYAVDGAYRLVFLFLFALQLAAWLWLLLGGRRPLQTS